MPGEGKSPVSCVPPKQMWQTQEKKNWSAGDHSSTVPPSDRPE